MYPLSKKIAQNEITIPKNAFAIDKRQFWQRPKLKRHILKSECKTIKNLGLKSIGQLLNFRQIIIY